VHPADEVSGLFLDCLGLYRFAREKENPRRARRGSAAGSLVAYCMEITDIDPLQNELLFGALSSNPETGVDAGYDIDFCNAARRGDKYVQQEVRRGQVAQIINVQHHGGEGGDQGRGPRVGQPYGEVDRIAKLIPATIGIRLKRALKDSPPLAAALTIRRYASETPAMRAEGLVRGAGVHAAGV